MKPTYIYTLTDPKNEAICYVIVVDIHNTRMERQQAVIRDSRNAMNYCIAQSDGERDLLNCMSDQGFSITWTYDGSGWPLTTDEYWPESEEN